MSIFKKGTLWLMAFLLCFMFALPAVSETPNSRLFVKDWDEPVDVALNPTADPDLTLDKISAACLDENNNMIVAWIEDMILKGELKPGERLPNEPDLARMFGVSRGALREALSALKAKGIIERRPGRGTYIRRIRRAELLNGLATRKGDDELFLDLLEVREWLESKVVELAIERGTPKDIEKIRDALQLLPRALSEGTPSPLEADLEFHLSLALAAHNEILFRLARNVNELLQDVRERTLMQPGRLAACQREHEAIFAAICDRDLDRALKAIKAHLNQVRREVGMDKTDVESAFMTTKRKEGQA